MYDFEWGRFGLGDGWFDREMEIEIEIVEDSSTDLLRRQGCTILLFLLLLLLPEILKATLVESMGSVLKHRQGLGSPFLLFARYTHMSFCVAT